MEHILTECTERAVSTIWQLAKDTWPHTHLPWPVISLGTILGCGCLTPPQPAPPNNNTPQPKRNYQGALRLLRILISESAYLIWVLRCERAIQGKNHSVNETQKRWLQSINKRLTEDKIIATTIKRDDAHTRKARTTWEAVLGRTEELPNDWIHQREVLVGTRLVSIGQRP